MTTATCIAATKYVEFVESPDGHLEEHHVMVMGDSASVGDGWGHALRSDSKVFRVGEFAVGFTSSFRMGQILRYSFVPPSHPADMDPHEYMCTLWVDGIRAAFVSKGYMSKDSEREYGGTFLVGYRGELYYVDSDFQVGVPSNGYSAVGCGQDLAMGAMYVLEGNHNKVQATATLTQALRAATEFSAGVSAPYRYVTTKTQDIVLVR